METEAEKNWKIIQEASARQAAGPPAETPAPSAWDRYCREHPEAPVPVRVVDSLVKRLEVLERHTEGPMVSESATLDEIIAAHPGAATPLSLFGALRSFTKDMNSRNVERNARLDAIEARVAELAAAPRGLEYQGPWLEDKMYARSDCVSYQGSMWVASEQTTARPGNGATPWRLAVKHGRDATRDVTR